MNTQPSEDILLHASGTFPDEAQEPTEESFKKVTQEISQTQKWRHRSLAAQILEDRFISVKQFRNRKRKDYWLNLFYINPQPKKTIDIAWKWGIAGLVFPGIAYALYSMGDLIPLSRVYLISGMVASVTLAIVSVLIMIQRSEIKLTYETNKGGAPVLGLAYNNPTKKEFREFVKKLNHSIQQLQSQDHRDQADLLAAEMHEHRRLKEANILTEETYEIAKNKILAQH
jgi:hypothetical protein